MGWLEQFTSHYSRWFLSFFSQQTFVLPYMDFDSLEAVGSRLGTGGFIVMDQSTDIVKAITRLAKFYKDESCGQCTPCREGTGWVWRLLERLCSGNVTIWKNIVFAGLGKRLRGLSKVLSAISDPRWKNGLKCIRGFRRGKKYPYSMEKVLYVKVIFPFCKPANKGEFLFLYFVTTKT